MTTNVHYHYHHSHCWNTHRLTSKALPIKSFSEVWLEIPVTRYKLTSSTKVLFFFFFFGDIFCRALEKVRYLIHKYRQLSGHR